MSGVTETDSGSKIGFQSYVREDITSGKKHHPSQILQLNRSHVHCLLYFSQRPTFYHVLTGLVLLNNIKQRLSNMQREQESLAGDSDKQLRHIEGEQPLQLVLDIC